ncbi:SCO3374 family protein [Streptomyces sp. NPDC093970]|uniref:SCO3374 family protein n=1 Tax=Streptomyces sp. NPDC093970 TaxID=3155076 RepID=UPI0034221170
MAGTVPLAASTVPHPRSPLVSTVCRATGAGHLAARIRRHALRHWYENDLGWATVPEAPGEPLRLVTGVRFDVLDVPAAAGAKALRHLGPGSPVALQGDRMRLLVAAGSAEELPGLLEWLEWGPLALDLRALGADGRMDAPARPEPLSIGTRVRPEAAEDLAGPPEAVGLPQPVEGAAVWLRPPGPGREAEDSLPRMPALPAMGGVGCAPDLVRLVDTMATECHRVRLWQGPRLEGDQALASS